MLAGISAEYYLRLEQGRDRNPSAQVLEAIARVLQVDVHHVLELAGDRPQRSRRRPRREVVPSSTARLVATLPLPAFVEGRYHDVLTANALARIISPRLVPGGNRLRDLLIDPAEQALFADWQGAAYALIAGFRQSVGGDVDDPRVIELVGELSLRSAFFQRAWARHDVAPRTGAVFTIDHPMVGAICFDREKLAISGTDGLMLVVYHPETGSQSADKLALLASAAAVPVADDHFGGGSSPVVADDRA